MAQTMAKVHDNATTGLDPEDNQQTLQQESANKLATVVPNHARGFSMGPL